MKNVASCCWEKNVRRQTNIINLLIRVNRRWSIKGNRIVLSSFIILLLFFVLFARFHILSTVPSSFSFCRRHNIHVKYDFFIEWNRNVLAISLIYQTRNKFLLLGSCHCGVTLTWNKVDSTIHSRLWSRSRNSGTLLDFIFSRKTFVDVVILGEF